MKAPDAEEGQETARRESRRKTVREGLLHMLDGDGDFQEQMLLAIREKALTGDLKTIEFILSIIGEKPGDRPKEPEQNVVRVELGPGVEELAM